MLLRMAVGLVFIVVPMLELMLLIKLGQGIGVLATVGLVVTTALTGAYIISRQSLSVVTRALQAASQGRPPVEPVVDGLFLLVAGALLLTPGLLTDVVALALLVPPMRRAIARACVRWFMRRAEVRLATYTRGEDTGHRRERTQASTGPDGRIIEGEFERVDERPASHRNGARRDSGPPASRG